MHLLIWSSLDSWFDGRGETSHETGSNKDCSIACDLGALGAMQAASWTVGGRKTITREGFLSTARAEIPRVSVPGNGRKDDSCLQLAFPFELSKPWTPYVARIMIAWLLIEQDFKMLVRIECTVNAQQTWCSFFFNFCMAHGYHSILMQYEAHWRIEGISRWSMVDVPGPLGVWAKGHRLAPLAIWDEGSCDLG